MKDELTHMVAETHSGQMRLGNHGRLTWIDRQRAAFQNANNAISLARIYSSSPIAASASMVYDVTGAKGRWDPPEAAGNVGGNVFGSQLGPTEKSASVQRGKVLPFVGLATGPTQVRYEPWLEEALEELATCPEDAIDDGFDEPSELGLIKAKSLLINLTIHVESKPDIYPMDQGSIAIDIRHSNGKVGILCIIERDGSGVLFSRSQKSKGRVRVDDAVDLLKEGGLSEMRRLGIGL